MFKQKCAMQPKAIAMDEDMAVEADLGEEVSVRDPDPWLALWPLAPPLKNNMSKKQEASSKKLGGLLECK